jgi:dTDP-4-amino-4,6-dideoxygalactose transaminase
MFMKDNGLVQSRATSVFENAQTGLIFGRDPGLLGLSADAGVPMPRTSALSQTGSNGLTISFIENKIYDFSRLSDLLSVSISLNHHANGGPMVKLLERMVAKVANLPQHRRVIAVSSGTSALQLAALFETKKIKTRKPRWVISSFGFFSSHIGSLANSIVIDCDASGRFDLEKLKEVPDNEYDGVVYTNIFAQHSNWSEVVDFCESHGKKIIVDNATGLLDRPDDSERYSRQPIEIISAHHTKPWGVGEGGFILCDESDEVELRSLTAFGCGASDDGRFCASNFKMSDLSAAGIIDRLETMAAWLPLYFLQEQRLTDALEASDLGVQKFRGQTSPVSPRSHTAFVFNHEFTFAQENSDFTIRKYYVPLGTSDVGPHELINAKKIYSSIFSLSNAPEMFKISDDKIVNRLRVLAKDFRI